MPLIPRSCFPSVERRSAIRLLLSRDWVRPRCDLALKLLCSHQFLKEATLERPLKRARRVSVKVPLPPRVGPKTYKRMTCGILPFPGEYLFERNLYHPQMILIPGIKATRLGMRGKACADMALRAFLRICNLYLPV